jgi:hypothetical protein
MTKLPDPDTRRRLRERHGNDPETTAALRALDRAADLLERSLWEFGSELRTEVEAFLGEPPLVNNPPR